jgi:POT family proton-dependent oligopeptide transporter
LPRRRRRARIKAAEEENKSDEEKAAEAATPKAELPTTVPWHMWLFLAAIVGAILWRVPAPANYYAALATALLPIYILLLPKDARTKTVHWIARHPLSDPKFAFFIFALIPVQTLFTYNWLVLPQYISRSFEGWIGDYFEIAANANPILIFILVPIITAVTQRAHVYNMMIWGTLIMAAPAFLLVIGPYWWTLFPYIFIMTIGEAMWQPRFLQYAAEIAPEGRTGTYMGVAQFPWFLTKLLVPLLYSGWMMDRYCPAEGPQDTQTMWLIFSFIAMTSTIFLLLAKGWLGKDFKTKA